MNPKTYRTLQILILVSLGIFLAQKLISGSLYYYINQRFFGLVWFGVAGFLFLAFILFRARGEAQAHEHEHEHEHDHDHDHEEKGALWALFLVALPVLLGVLIPASPLGASAIGNRGISANAPLTFDASGSLFQLEVPPNDRTILDWVRMYNFSQDPAEMIGQAADVVGFVYQDPRLSEGQFMVGRFTLSCCVADAFAIGMIVAWPDSANLPDNQWVRVKGPVDVLAIEGQTLPLIHAESVQTVDEPAQPYLFP
ncbi:MAG TPA: TIGR03943 family protein [Anaerolineales bacterium]|nr:TIGR03943 family protein [Anaerolineales bacterium]